MTKTNGSASSEKIERREKGRMKREKDVELRFSPFPSSHCTKTASSCKASSSSRTHRSPWKTHTALKRRQRIPALVPLNDQFCSSASPSSSFYWFTATHSPSIRTKTIIPSHFYFTVCVYSMKSFVMKRKTWWKIASASLSHDSLNVNVIFPEVVCNNFSPEHESKWLNDFYWRMNQTDVSKWPMVLKLLIISTDWFTRRHLCSQVATRETVHEF